MKQLLITIAAVVLVGCGESQQSATAPEAEPTEPLAGAAKPEPPTAKAPNISIVDAALSGNIKAVKQHIAAGTDVNAKLAHGQGKKTLLHLAAANGHKEVVELLIAKGLDMNAKTGGGVTPLYLAVRFNRTETAKLLIAKGADVNAKTKDGMTPLDKATENDGTKTANLLRKHGGKTGAELKAAGN